MTATPASPSASSAPDTVADTVVASLTANGIDTLYCLPGVQNDPFFDALHRAGNALRPIHTRHEQAAGYMALGAAMASGRPQAYCVVPGPGMLNTGAALATAYATHAPVLALSGEIASTLIGRDFGELHEIPDQLGVLKRLTKQAERLENPVDAARLMDAAFAALRDGAPRPVGVEVPMDLWAKPTGPSTDSGLPAAVGKDAAADLDHDAIAKAADHLAKAKAPMIVVGGGAQAAGDAIRALSHHLQAPVVANLQGRGVVDAREPLSLTGPGGYALWPQVDCVIGIGTRFMTPLRFWGSDDDLTIIHMDVAPERLGVHAPVDVGIVARVESAMPALLEAVRARCDPAPSREQEMAALGRLLAREQEPFAPQIAFLNAIRKALPDDGIFIDELTQVGYVGRFAFPVHQPRTYLCTGYQGTLGWGLPTALGAKAAMPDRPVLAISGDGGILYAIGELATAVRHKLSVTLVIFTDNAYGNVRRIQATHYDGRTIASDLANPDYVKLAESFGVRGVRVETASALEGVLAEVVGGPDTTVIEVPVGTFSDPWPYMRRPRLRGTKG
ncbi:MAG: thiamine pyrophosphate-dependent enzyme [Pseudomonadota bacterium]